MSGTSGATRLPDPAGFRSALIVKPSSLGDVIHALPAVHALHTAWPHLELRWVVNPEWAPLLEGLPMLREVIRFPRKTFRGAALPARALRWGAGFRHQERALPELVLDFQGLLRSGLIAAARGGGPIIGLSDAREGARFFYRHTVAVDAAAHAVDRYLALPRALGARLGDGEIHFPLPAGFAPAGWPVGDGAEGVVVIHPWSRGSGKSLSPAALQALCDCLAPAPVAVLGMRGDNPAPTGGHVIDLSDRTSLLELVWCLRQARFCVSVDSGPMHIAAAVNDRTLGLHTWSDPRRVGPYNPKAWVWKAGRIGRWRSDFSQAECEREGEITPEVAGRIGEFVVAGGAG